MLVLSLCEVTETVLPYTVNRMTSLYDHTVTSYGLMRLCENMETASPRSAPAATSPKDCVGLVVAICYRLYTD